MQVSNYNNQRPYSSMEVSGTCRATSDPVKFSGEGKATAVSFNVAFNFVGTAANGGLKNFSDYYQVNVFKKTADLVLEQVRKGDKLYISGTVFPREYYSKKHNQESTQSVINATIVAPTFDSKVRTSGSGNGNTGSRPSNQAAPRNNESSYDYDDGFGDYDDSVNNTDGYASGEDLLR